MPEVEEQPAPQYVTVMGYRVFSDDLGVLPWEGPCRTVNTISPNSYGISTHDAEFETALKATDVLVLDGVYFGLASIFLQRRLIRANQGPDVFAFFIKQLEGRRGRAFFLGSTDRTLGLIRERMAKECPNVTVGSYSPPHKKIFAEEDERVMLEEVRAFGADVLFVGMTVPKQEKWVHKFKHQLDSRFVVSIGAVFDWYAGTTPPIAPVWWRLRLAWLVRTIQRPEILRRYPDIFIFFRHLALTMLGLKKLAHVRD
jgi:N-acetylglucosaminyldiphosphoundecaprenol N-acetyl-beta-D-mannosaminyltransferase